MFRKRMRFAVALSLVLVACRHEDAPPAPPAAPQAITPPAPAAAAPGTRPLVPPADAQRLPNGVPYVVVNPGTGTDPPADDDEVVVQYELWQPSGELIDSTLVKQKPVTLLVVKTPPG